MVEPIKKKWCEKCEDTTDHIDAYDGSYICNECVDSFDDPNTVPYDDETDYDEGYIHDEY